MYYILARSDKGMTPDSQIGNATRELTCNMVAM
jgi:hypothetical protein